MPTSDPSSKTYTDAEITARGREALQQYAPYSMRRVVDPNSINFVQGKVGSGKRYASNSQNDYAGVEQGNPSDVHVEDVDAFMDPDNTPQLALHEYSHTFVNRLHPTVRAKMPPVNENNPYDYGGDAGLKSTWNSGAKSLGLSDEQMGAVAQQYGALMTGYRKAQAANKVTPALQAQYMRAQHVYLPYLDHLASQPTTVIQPTAPDAKAINTTPVDPGLPPANVAGTEAFQKATQILPTDDTDLGFQPTAASGGDDDLGFRPMAAIHDEVGFTPLPATPGGIDMSKVAGAVPGMGAPTAPPVPMRPLKVSEAVTNQAESPAAYAADQAADQQLKKNGPMYNGRPLSESLDPQRGGFTEIAHGVRDLMKPGQREAGATEALEGVGKSISSPLLPEAAPLDLLTGVASSALGAYAAPKVVKSLGGTEADQRLARAAGGVLPMAAGIGSGIAHGGPEILPPEETPNAGGLPTPGPQTIEGKVTHPAGKVTGIDQATGLPIVDRTQPATEAAQTPIEPNVPRGTSATVAPGAEVAPHATNALPTLPVHPETGREILQNSSDPEALREDAKAAAPELKTKLEHAVDGVPGAKVEAVREEKSPERIEEKTGTGKPVETQPDHLAARITADTPEAKEQVAANLAEQGVVRREDNYDKPGGPNDFRADTHQVLVTRDPNGALQTAEVQVLTPEQNETAEANHKLYERQRTAAANGDTELADKLAKQLSDANNHAAKEAEQRQSEPAQKSPISRMNPATIDFDPKRFQYKMNTDAQEARAIGALQNIAEGRGTAMDAAKFFRDSGYTPKDLNEQGISLGEATAANGMAMARLDPGIFDKVVSGKIAPGRAVAIGNATDVPAQQEAILKLIERKEASGRTVTNETINELVRMAKGAGEHTDHQVDLFGSHTDTRNLALEKAEVSSSIRAQISQEKRDFGSVADAGKAERLTTAGNTINAEKNATRAKSAVQALELYDRLSSKAGPVDDILNRAAEELASGKSPATVKREAYDRARAALAEALPGSAEANPRRVQETPAQSESAAERLKAPKLPEKTQTAGLQKWEPNTPVLVTDPATGELRAGTIAHFNHGANGAPRRARVSLADGGKLDGVREESLTRLAPWPDEPHTTNSDLEAKLVRRAQEETPKLISEYQKENTKDGVLTLAVDSAKNLFPEYRENPTARNEDTWAAARGLVTVMRDTILSRPPEAGKEFLHINTGSPGSGKTSGYAPGAAEGVGLRMEAILSDPKRSAETIQKILDSGRKPVVNVYYTDDPRTTVERMITRANAIGRPVNVNYMAKAYVDVPKVVAGLKEHFGNDLTVNGFDNSGQPGDVKAYNGSVEPAVKATQGWTEPTALEAMHGRLDELQREGQVSPELYRAVGGKAGAAESGTGLESDRGSERAVGEGSSGGLRGSVLDEGRGSETNEKPENRISGTDTSRQRDTNSRSNDLSNTRRNISRETRISSGAANDYREQVKAAQSRSLKENASLQKSTVQEIAGRKAVVLDADGLALWHRALTRFAKELGVGKSWRGMTIEKANVNRALLVLRAQAGSALLEPGGTQASAGYERMMHTLEEAKDERGTVTLLRGDYRADTAREEAVHAWQIANSLDKSEAMRDVAARPEFEETAERLRDMGYDGPGSDRNELASEMMAKALAGDPDLKITDDQRYDLVHAFLSKAVEEEGPEILKNLPAMADEDKAVKLAIQEARRTYDFDGGQDEGGAGQETRGAVRKGDARGPEPGSGGRSLQRADRGQSEAAGVQPGDAGAGEEKSQLGPKFQRDSDEPAPRWYLKSEKLIDNKMRGPMAGDDLLRMLHNNGVKADELKWTGLEDLKGKDRVTPGEVKGQLALSTAQMQEVTKGPGPVFHKPFSTEAELRAAINGDDMLMKPDGVTLRSGLAIHHGSDGWNLHDASDKGEAGTKFRTYQLHGGENYREMLLKLSDSADRAKPGTRAAEGLEPGQDFRSSHWDEPNVLTHIRFNDRTSSDGKKLLHIEEIQSDWHQKGRSKGYQGDTKGFAVGESTGYPGKYEIRNPDGRLVAGNFESREAAEKAIPTVARNTDSGVPDAPFKKDWHEMAFRRMVRHAAENGYDGVSWTPGQQQAARYDLSKQIKELNVFTRHDGSGYDLSSKTNSGGLHDIASHVTQSKLSDYVGKDLAEKILEGEGQRDHAADSNKGGKGYWRNFSGVDLKVGGEGMKGFYDKIIPDYANKFGKRWGAKVGEVTLPDGNYLGKEPGPRDLSGVPMLPVTDAMRKSVMSEGLPLFQRESEDANKTELAMEDLIRALKEMPSGKVTATEHFVESFGRAIDASKRTGNWVERRMAALPGDLKDLWKGYAGLPEHTEFKQAVGRKLLYETQIALKQLTFAKEIKRVAPKDEDQIALTHWIQAGGDDKVLQHQRSETRAALQGWRNLAEAEKAERARLKAAGTPKQKLEAAMENWHRTMQAMGGKGMPGNPRSYIRPLTDRSHYYDLATRLTPEQKALGLEIKKFNDEMLHVGQEEGVLHQGAMNYVHQMYDKGDADQLANIIATDELNPNPSFIKQRIFRSYFEAENAGMVPKDKRIGFLTSVTADSMAKAISSRRMLRELLEARAGDESADKFFEVGGAHNTGPKPFVLRAKGGEEVLGRYGTEADAWKDAEERKGNLRRPIAAMQGTGKWVLAKDAEMPQILHQTSRPEAVRDYKTIDAPQLRNFLWAPTTADIESLDPKLFEDDPKRLAFKGSVVIHPAYAGHVKAMVEPSWFEGEGKGSKVGKGILTGSTMAKEGMTLLSPFHQMYVTTAGVMAGVNPFRLPEIDLSQKDQASLVSHGFKAVEISAEGLFSAKLMKGLVEHVPLANKAADWTQNYSHYLFTDYIPRIKMAAGLNMLKWNRRIYGNRFSDDQIQEQTAKQANSLFGGLNHLFDAFPRNKTHQDLLRLALFASDFEEGNVRFASSAGKPTGAVPLAMLAGAALVLYTGSRVLNMLLNKGNPHFDYPLSVVVKDRAYALRSPLSIIEEAYRDPRMFAYNRMNPLVLRPFIELISHTDQYGRQKTPFSVAKDVVKDLLPITVQKVVQTSDENWEDSLLSSFGVNASKYRTPTEARVHKLYLAGISAAPEDDEHKAANRRNYQLTDKLRNHEITTTQLWSHVKNGEISAAEASRIQTRARHSDLYNEYTQLHMKDALAVFEHANLAEKLELKPELERKTLAQEAKLPEIEGRALHAKVEGLVNPKRTATP